MAERFDRIGSSCLYFIGEKFHLEEGELKLYSLYETATYSFCPFLALMHSMSSGPFLPSSLHSFLASLVVILTAAASGTVVLGAYWALATETAKRRQIIFRILHSFVFVILFIKDGFDLHALVPLNFNDSLFTVHQISPADSAFGL
jgi:hypothetical protein